MRKIWTIAAASIAHHSDQDVSTAVILMPVFSGRRPGDARG